MIMAQILWGQFYVDFMGRVFGSSLRSNFWVNFTWCFYGSILWDRFMGRVYESSFQAKFMDQVYEPSLLVLFSGLVYRSSFWFDFTNEFTGLVYRSSLRVRFINWDYVSCFIHQFCWSSLRIEFLDRVCGSSLGSYYTGSNFQVDFTSHVFCLSLRLNLQVDCRGHVYGTSLRDEPPCTKMGKRRSMEATKMQLEWRSGVKLEGSWSNEDEVEMKPRKEVYSREGG